MGWERVLTVAISVAVIILVAVLERYSSTLAAITATMPLTVPLALWIVYVAEGGDRVIVTEFSRSMLIGIWPTMFFLVTAWLGIRAGWRILPTITVGYATWAVSVVLLFGLRQILGQ